MNCSRTKRHYTFGRILKSFTSSVRQDDRFSAHIYKRILTYCYHVWNTYIHSGQEDFILVVSHCSKMLVVWIIRFSGHNG